MAGNKHPIPIAIVDSHELLSTSATPWKGNDLRAKKIKTLSAKAALRDDPLCA
jgi:hypothetical protein